MSVLGKNGYVSFQAGKWWEGPCHCGSFTEGMTHGDPARGGRHGDAGLKIGREGMSAVLEFVDRAADKPFLLWYAPMLPHLPHNPPPRLLAKYTAPGRPESLARYWAMCEWFDETIGELLGHLEKKKLTEKTIVVYLADNGWVQNEQFPEGKGPFGNLRGKRTPYEGGVRTPILVRWPGKIPPGRDEQNLASSIDLMPTLLTACGIAAPNGLPGINLLDKNRLSARKSIYGELFAHDVRDLSNPAASLSHRWVIEERWKLIAHSDATAPAELYDLVGDPHEKTDLAPKEPARVQTMRAQLDAW